MKQKKPYMYRKKKKTRTRMNEKKMLEMLKEKGNLTLLRCVRLYRKRREKEKGAIMKLFEREKL